MTIIQIDRAGHKIYIYKEIFRDCIQKTVCAAPVGIAHTFFL